MGQVIISPPLAISPEVEAFASQEGVGPYLQDVILMTSRIFPNCQINALVETDPEIADNRHILLEVKTNMEVAEALQAEYHWHEGLFANCPAPQAPVFRLGLGHDEEL